MPQAAKRAGKGCVRAAGAPVGGTMCVSCIVTLLMQAPFTRLVVTRWTKGHVLHVSIAHGMQQHAAGEIDTSHDEQLEKNGTAVVETARVQVSIHNTQ
jgi:hypothetical protein